MIFVAHSNGVILAVGNSALECTLYIDGHNEYDIACIEAELIDSDLVEGGYYER